MSQSKIKCVFCNAYLFEDDDIVCCPECGAPHHRECYQKAGQCALHQKHGTDEQYKRPPLNAEPKEQENTAEQTQAEQNTAICPRCKREVSKDAVFCPYCRLILKPGENPFKAAVSAEFNTEQVIDSIKIKELMSFVFVNPLRYIRKFMAFSKGSKASWNWLAFLFPSQWMLLRKMYKKGALVFALSLAALILMLPMSATLSSVYIDEGSTYPQVITSMIAALDGVSVPIMLTTALGSLLDIAVRIFCGIYGDKMYRDHVFERVKELKREDSFVESTILSKAGGVNIWMFLLSWMAIDYLPMIIASFIL